MKSLKNNGDLELHTEVPSTGVSYIGVQKQANNYQCHILWTSCSFQVLSKGSHLKCTNNQIRRDQRLSDSK